MVYTSYIYEQGVKKQVFTLCNSNRAKVVKNGPITSLIECRLLDKDVEQIFKAQSSYYARLVTGKIIKL